MSQLIHFPVGLHALWHSANDINIDQARLGDWLLNTGSLTERLQANCAHFEVELLGQQIATPQADELEALGISPINGNQTSHHEWQVREVILHGDGKPWVFARSILPTQLCETSWQNLGTQPLGQRIFNDNSFVRSHFSVASLHQHPLLGHAEQAQLVEPLWARRSTFNIAQWQLLVAEVFLPDCPSYR